MVEVEGYRVNVRSKGRDGIGVSKGRGRDMLRCRGGGRCRGWCRVRLELTLDSAGRRAEGTWGCRSDMCRTSL